MTARQFVFLPYPHQAAWEARERYLDLEGAYRSGKTTLALLRLRRAAEQYPGMHWLLSRWTEETTYAQLRPMFLDLCRDLVERWVADEGCYLLRSADPDRPVRVYIRGLRPAEGTSPFSKIHGLKLASAIWDQAEEIPEEYFDHMHTRLSQPGYPQQLILAANPPTKNHWIARRFPLDNSRVAQGFRYVRFTMRDNAAGVGEAFIAEAERGLKDRPAEYRRAILGERGVPIKGQPVYEGLFDLARHVGDPPYIPAIPLIESWDFGHRHPAVVWLQFPPGQCQVLGAIMGSSLDLDAFSQHVAAQRRAWFPGLRADMTWWTCDPAGASKSSHGTRSAVEVLRQLGLSPLVVPDANTPPKRTYALQTLMTYLRRAFPDGTPACQVSPRCVLVDAQGTCTAEDPVLIDGFSVGYVWDDDHVYQGTQYSNLRRPTKDGWYEHVMNAVEYAIIAFAPPDAGEPLGLVFGDRAERRARALLEEHGVPATEPNIRTLAHDILVIRHRLDTERLHAHALRIAQRDDDPYDREHAPTGRGRGGY